MPVENPQTATGYLRRVTDLYKGFYFFYDLFKQGFNEIELTNLRELS